MKSRINTNFSNFLWRKFYIATNYKPEVKVVADDQSLEPYLVVVENGVMGTSFPWKTLIYCEWMLWNGDTSCWSLKARHQPGHLKFQACPGMQLHTHTHTHENRQQELKYYLQQWHNWRYTFAWITSQLATDA